MFIRKKILSASDGFSLLELAITVGIVGVVATIAVASYMGWRPGYELRGAVSQVRGELNRAKMRAVESRRQCRVTFSTTGYQLNDGNEVMASSQWGNFAANGVFTAGTPFRTGNLNDFPQVTFMDGTGAAIVAGTATEPAITFSPRGTATLDSLQVVHPTAGTVTIRVNITGRINIVWP